MTTATQKVRDAVDRGKPGEALLILAEAVDAMTVHEQRIIATDGDWSLPDEPPSDPEDRRAWEAAMRLAQDTEPTPDIGVDRTQLVTITTDSGTEIRVPPSTPEAEEARTKIIGQLGIATGDCFSKAELRLSPQVSVAAYVKGGPIWLHAYDRDFVMGLPAAMRRAMVQDVESYSPGDAHLLGRDILKDTDPAANRGVQLEALA